MTKKLSSAPTCANERTSAKIRATSYSVPVDAGRRTVRTDLVIDRIRQRLAVDLPAIAVHRELIQRHPCSWNHVFRQQLGQMRPQALDSRRHASRW